MLSKINHRVLIAVMLHFVCIKQAADKLKLCKFSRKQHASYQNVNFVPLPSLPIPWEPLEMQYTYSGLPKLVSSSY